MEKRRVGAWEVGLLGLGCNNFGTRCDRDGAAAVVAAALDEGATLFDTADAYGAGRSEEILGAVLGRHRDEVVVATKFGMKVGTESTGGARPDAVVRAAEASLRRLSTDRIDLYQLHFPDRETPVEDTVAALVDLVAAGKVLAFGCCNLSQDGLREWLAATADAGPPIASMQAYYNVLARGAEQELGPLCDEAGLAFMPYFPLESGLLTGKYEPGAPPPAGTRLGDGDLIDARRIAKILDPANVERSEALRAFAVSEGRTLLELALSFLATRPFVSCIPVGATKPEQVRANAAALGWAIDDQALATIDRIAPPS